MSSLVEVVKFKILTVHFVFSNVILSQVVSVVTNKEHSNNPLYIAVCTYIHTYIHTYINFI